jgi:hypothetical protein
MPLPTASDVHVNRPLTNISVATIQKETNFVASQAFPTVPVQSKSDIYFLYDNAYWNSDEMKDRAPSTESAGGAYTVDKTNTYVCAPKAIHKDIDDQIRANADSPLDLDREATIYVTQKALIARERLFATNYMAGSVWTRDYDGVAASPSTNEVLQWNDSSSTPIQDVWDAKSDVLDSTGFEPNILVIGYAVYKELINHADIVDRVKYGQSPGSPAMIDTSELASVFKVDKVLVSRAIYRSSAEGASTTTQASIVGKTALLVYAPPAPGIMTPSGGYIFTWTGYLGAGPAGQRIKKFRMDHLNSDRVEIEIAYDMKVVSADLGAFWASIVA